jgi:hypothetical protein
VILYTCREFKTEIKNAISAIERVSITEIKSIIIIRTIIIMKTAIVG